MLFEVSSRISQLAKKAKCLLSDHHKVPGSGKEVQLALGPAGSSVRRLHRNTSGQRQVKSTCLFFLLWFPDFAVLQFTEIPASTLAHHQPIFQSNLLVQPSSPFPHLHKSFKNCFLLAAFSQLLPVGTERHSKSGNEILCIWAGLMFLTSVLH